MQERDQVFLIPLMLKREHPSLPILQLSTAEAEIVLKVQPPNPAEADYVQRRLGIDLISLSTDKSRVCEKARRA